jgi:hypothetical protein
MLRRTLSSGSRSGVPTAIHIGGMMVLSWAMVSCAVDEPTAVGRNPGVSLAKAPPPSVTVTSTDPTYAFQGDSVVTVRVKGTGFAEGAHASWQINGDTTHVHELNTSFVSSTEVVATIKVDLDAPTALYDVVVTLLNGKKGVGAELFTVKSVNERQQDPVPIGVTVEDAGVLGPYRIQSDGRGEYLNGMQGMQAEIDQFGNLQISPNNGQATTPAQRQLTFDFSVPADPLNLYRPDVTGQTNFKILSNDYGNPRIQDLGVSGNPASACYRVTFAFRNATTHHQIDYNTGINAQAAFVLITRTSASTWTVVSDGPCGANPGWGFVRSQDLVRKNAPLVQRGNYVMTFSIRLRTL